MGGSISNPAPTAVEVQQARTPPAQVTYTSTSVAAISAAAASTKYSTGFGVKILAGYGAWNRRAFCAWGLGSNGGDVTHAYLYTSSTAVPAAGATIPSGDTLVSDWSYNIQSSGSALLGVITGAEFQQTADVYLYLAFVSSAAASITPQLWPTTGQVSQTPFAIYGAGASAISPTGFSCYLRVV